MTVEDIYMYLKYQKYKTKYLDLRGGQVEGELQEDARETFGLLINRLKPHFEALINTKEPLNRQLDTLVMESILDELESYSQDYYHIHFDQDDFKTKLDVDVLPQPGDIKSEIFLKMAKCDNIYKKCPITPEDLVKVNDLLTNQEILPDVGQSNLFFIIIDKFLKFIYDLLVNPAADKNQNQNQNEKLVQSNNDCLDEDEDEYD